MQTMTVTIPEAREPDWETAFRAIRALPLQALCGTGDDLFPLENWAGQSGRLQEMAEAGSFELAAPPVWENAARISGRQSDHDGSRAMTQPPVGICEPARVVRQVRAAISDLPFDRKGAA
jgi:hypothetical protein